MQKPKMAKTTTYALKSSTKDDVAFEVPKKLKKREEGQPELADPSLVSDNTFYSQRVRLFQNRIATPESRDPRAQTNGLEKELKSCTHVRWYATTPAINSFSLPVACCPVCLSFDNVLSDTLNNSSGNHRTKQDYHSCPPTHLLARRSSGNALGDEYHHKTSWALRLRHISAASLDHRKQSP